jgi:cellulose synthase operon protein C
MSCLRGLHPARFRPSQPPRDRCSADSSEQSASVLPAVQADAPRVKVRDLPLGLPQGRVPTEPADLLPNAVKALGVAGALALEKRLMSSSSLSDAGIDPGIGHSGGYPGHYAWIENLLNAAPARARSDAAAALGAQLVALAGEPGHRGRFSIAPVAYPDAAPIAYALLSRARPVAGCAASLNLLLLLTADIQPHDDLVAERAKDALTACPGDPTPGWLLGQFQSQRARVDGVDELSPVEVPVPEDRMQRVRHTFEALTSAFPGSADVWAGVADMHLRAGDELKVSQPFSSREEYRLALAAYQRADLLGAGPAATAGIVRAHIGLGHPDQATASATTLLDQLRRPAPALNLLVLAAEASHKWQTASETAQKLSRLGPDAYAHQGPLFPREGSLSTGVDRLVPLTVSLAPCCDGFGGGDVTDVSFIPLYRTDWRLIGSISDCPEWSWRRDALLARHAAAALVNYPEVFYNTHLGAEMVCGDADGLLDVLKIEAGAPLTADEKQWIDLTQDSLQNLWRWAGDFDRATATVVRWDRESKNKQFLPALRLGEIQYLRGHYTEAAGTFAMATRRSENGSRITIDGSRARLARGAALIAAGRATEARNLLRELERDAYGAHAYFRQKDDSYAFSYAVACYYARLQLGDLERRAGEFDAAVEDYAAARELLPLESYDAHVIPNVLDNNQALAELALNQIDAAQGHTKAALSIDPENPIFLLTAAAVAEQTGLFAPAADLNNAALQSDPTAFPAANNLGVELARQGRKVEAARAFRQAVGSRHDYAIAWFNLGVLYSTRGALYLSFAQGAFGRAYELDPGLQTHRRELMLDEHVYQTDLDLSKPLPPDWGLGNVERRQPLAALGLLAGVALALGVSRAIAGNSQINITKTLGSRAVRTTLPPPRPATARRLGRSRYRHRFRHSCRCVGRDWAHRHRRVRHCRAVPGGWRGRIPTDARRALVSCTRPSNLAAWAIDQRHQWRCRRSLGCRSLRSRAAPRRKHPSRRTCWLGRNRRRTPA